ncbi:MAG TPA: hypothetical protein VGB08_05500 [Allosphingosinicella sp.]|jgi:hypothetical protein
MPAPTAAQLIALWDRSQRSAHRRLEPLLSVMEPGAVLGDDTLGRRNQRLLALHAALSEAPLDARLHCSACRTDNEFAVPAAAILGCPAPGAAARVAIRSGRRRLTFRLPLMSDIHGAKGRSEAEILAQIASRCRLDADGGEPVPATVLAQLAARFDEIDPAASIVVDLSCAECGAALRASVDVAEFVATRIDAIADRLLRQIDVIAGAYGWSEDAILALPPARRTQYVEMIAARAPATRTRAPLAMPA